MNINLVYSRIGKFTGGLFFIGFCAAPVYACENWYLTGKIGASQYEDVHYSYNTDTGYGVGGGCQFNKYFAEELEYIYLGKAAFAQNKEFSTSGASINLVGIIPFEKLSLFGRMGLFFARVKSLGAMPSNSSTGKNYSIGIEIPITQAFSFRTEHGFYEAASPNYSDYPNSNYSSNMSIYHFSFDLKYKF